MGLHIDYYASLNSPWTHLGAARIEAMAAKHGASLRIWPVDFGTIFAASGGLPLPKRAPQRQAYRLLELKRHSEHLQLPLNLQPKYFPVAADDAARLIIAVDMHDGCAAAMTISAAIFSAVWVQERNIADATVLAGLLNACSLKPERLAEAHAPEVQAAYDANTRQAIDIGVFGAPTYVLHGQAGSEMFWGQDRLDFVERKLQSL